MSNVFWCFYSRRAPYDWRVAQKYLLLTLFARSTLFKIRFLGAAYDVTPATKGVAVTSAFEDTLTVLSTHTCWIGLRSGRRVTRKLYT